MNTGSGFSKFSHEHAANAGHGKSCEGVYRLTSLSRSPRRSL